LRILHFGVKRFLLDKATETTSLYIHVPFCLKKCPYCDFFSVPVEAHDLSAYADLLIRHLQLLSAQPGNDKQLESIFFGGGTPSLLPPDDVGRILKIAEEQFGFVEDIEISLEANPGTIDQERLAGFRAAGINRLSLGVQSLCDQRLGQLERPYSVAEAEAALRMSRTSGFKNLSCDLMFALPGQTIEAVRTDVDRILAFAPDHLAIYGLTVEAGTPLFLQEQAGEWPGFDEDLYADMYLMLHETLASEGYRHYEISNFSRPGSECRHNLRYWQRQENLAVGAGGHSFREAVWGERWATPDNLAGYQQALETDHDPAERIECFNKAAAMFETLYLGLRTDRGVDDKMFSSRFGCTVNEAYPEAVEHCGARIERNEGFWRLDIEGWLLFNTLLARFD